MSWEVCNETENLGQFASGKGYADLIAAAKGPSPLRTLLETGHSQQVEEIISGLEAIEGPEDVRETARGLARMIQGAKDILITDGLTESMTVRKIDDVEIEGTVIKLDAEKQLVFGWFSIISVNGRPVEDTQGDVIDEPTLEDAAYEFVLEFRAGGEMHEKEGDAVRVVGRLVESCVFTREKQQAMVRSLQEQGIPASLDLGCAAWWGGFKVYDADAWKRVISGELRGWSIGGRGKREKIEG